VEGKTLKKEKRKIRGGKLIFKNNFKIFGRTINLYAVFVIYSYFLMNFTFTTKKRKEQNFVKISPYLADPFPFECPPKGDNLWL
jgi:hypothetical protein